MENYGLIIHRLRVLAGLSVQKTAQKIGKSTGWLSEIENSCGTARLTETEFNRIVELLDGATHKAIFKTWVSNFKTQERLDRTYDGAILKFIRKKKGLSLKAASERVGLSWSQISKIENGRKLFK